MDKKQNNPNKNKPNNEGDKGKHIGTAVIISLAIILLFTWVYNAISNSQYTQTTYSQFLEAKEAGNLSEVLVKYDRIIYMTAEEAAKEPSQQRACFTGLPVGIDAQKVLQTGITPCLHGGIFSKDGGLLGAGMARIPIECFEKAMDAFHATYREG